MQLIDVKFISTTPYDNRIPSRYDTDIGSMPVRDSRTPDTTGVVPKLALQNQLQTSLYGRMNQRFLNDLNELVNNPSLKPPHAQTARGLNRHGVPRRKGKGS